MNEISSEVIPFAFYFFAIIFYIALLGNEKKINKEKNKEFQNFKHEDEKVKSFLFDSEKKLLALKDLHEQGLIDFDLYLNKTNQIANVVTKIIDNNIFDYGKNKNEQIIDDLKKGIIKKLKKESFTNKKNMDIDSLLVSIDKKIKNNSDKDIKIYER
ncbi:MAG: hypothetical protein CMP37_02700 [Rickettsiales bacterium]|nr:hypothetical protein [Rickettsiales bacterium]OUW71329.1 MAG: hypothetical protein CBD71_02675 [Rickettsiales bacterium TMED211]